MTVLYIDRKDIELRVSGGALEFHEPAGKRGSFPLTQIDRIVLRGRAHLSTSVLGALTNAGAGLLVLSGRHNRHLATCVGRPHNDVFRRLGQFATYMDRGSRAKWSRDLIAAKTYSQVRLLRRALERRPDRRRSLTRAIRQLEELAKRTSGAVEPPDIPRLLGIEGAAAAAYFKGLCSLFPSSLNFEGRNRRPPRDPVNACLSLGYTLVHFEAVMCCHAAGLDPLLGLYHEPVHGRESLAADVMEPLRAHVDEWVWELFRERVLTARSFSEDNGAVLLGKTARNHFYSRYRPLGAAMHRLLRQQMRAVAREFEEKGRNLSASVSREAVFR